jgi:hypothetical protein
MLLATVVLCSFVTASAFSSSPAGAAAAVFDTTTNQNFNHDIIQPIIQIKQDSSAFEILAQKAIHTLLKSDSDTDENEHAYGSASQGLWINSKSAKEMQNVLDRVVLQVSCV